MIQLDLEAKGVSQGLLTFTAGVRAKEWRHFRSLFFLYPAYYLSSSLSHGMGSSFFYLAQFSTLLGFRRCKMKVKHYLKDLRIGKCHQYYKLIPFLRSSTSNYSNDIFPANIILLCDLCVCHTSKK